MNSQHRAIRARIAGMTPTRAVEYVEAFGLPEEEAAVLIFCVVRKKSQLEAAIVHKMSVETVKERCHAALSKIADHYNNV
jgi:DNA-directed RNA polymerase specialized sigma24 family protein